MFILSCWWILIGAGVGALAVAAGWGVVGAGWSRSATWLATLGIGALASLGGGWLGSLLLDRYYTTPTALWVSALSVMILPRLTARLARRSHTTPSA